MTRLTRIAALLVLLTPAVTEAEEAPEIDGLEIIVERYCANIRDAAAEARILRQQNALTEMETKIEERLSQLEKRRDEYRHWVAERERLLEEASDHVASIYGGMRPDAAALQLVEMDPRTAAAVLARLDTRSAGAIMAEMEPQAAGLLASVMTGNVEIGGDARQMR